jgi:hypothetical protein
VMDDFRGGDLVLTERRKPEPCQRARLAVRCLRPGVQFSLPRVLECPKSRFPRDRSRNCGDRR